MYSINVIFPSSLRSLGRAFSISGIMSQIKDHEKKSFDSLFEFLYYNVFDQDKDVNFVNYKLSYEVVPLKTSKGFEGKYIDYVSSVTNKRILAVGPLVTDGDQTEEESSEILFPVMEKTMSIEEALPQGFLDKVKDGTSRVGMTRPLFNTASYIKKA
ncbi:hypothetical protein ACS0TY_023057 [Phlomoides rotata]